MKGLEDPEPRIADLAKLFFTELSTKENTIYDSSVSLACVHIMRLLTHVLQSSLSIGEHTNDEETFQSTTRHILSFIEKVRP